MKRLSAVLKGVTEGMDDEGDEDEGTCPVTGEPWACEAREESDGEACEGCEGCEGPDEDEGDEGEDEGMDAADASEAVGHWAGALIEAAKRQQQGAALGAVHAAIARRKAMGEAVGAATSPRMLTYIIEPIFRRAGMVPWAQGASRTWHLFVNKDNGPEADSKAFVTFWKNPDGDWQLFSGVPTEGFPETRRYLQMSPSATTSGQSAKKDDALLAAADGKRTLNQNYLLAVVKQVADSKWLEIKRKGSRVVDIAPKATAMGEAEERLAEGAEADTRKLIEHGDTMLKVLDDHVGALRKGVAAAQAELKGYARIGVPGRASSALLKKHLLGPAERMEDTAKKVRETIEEGIKVFG